MNTQFNSVFLPVGLAWKRSTGVAANCPVVYTFELAPPIAYDTGGDYVHGTEALYQPLGLGLNGVYKVSLDAESGNTPACPTQESASGGISTVTAHAVQQSAGTLGPKWKTTRVTGALGGSLKRTTKTGATAVFTCTCKNVGVVGTTGRHYGSVRLFVDGAKKGLFSAHAAHTTQQAIFVKYGWNAVGKHTIKIKVLKSKGHQRIDVDGFVYLS